MKTLPFTLGLLLSVLPMTPATAQSYDVAADFSLAGNPNGNWQYGTTGTTLTGSFTLFTISNSAYIGNANFHAWTGTEPAFGSLYPAVAKNTAGTNQTGGGGFVPLLPGQLFITPGPSGAYGVSRFTTSVAGQYQIDALFQGRDTRGATTDVHILLNGVSIFDGIVNGFDTPSNQPFSGLQTLAVGDRLDFAVGFGSNATFFSDSTALAATISAVPEPATILCAAISVAGLGMVAWRKKRRVRRKQKPCPTGVS